MRLGVLRVSLLVTGAQSLKEKRRVVRSLKDRLLSRFNVSVAEVGAHDLWQRAELGLALVAGDSKSADALLRKLEEFVRGHPGAAVLGIERSILDPGEVDGEEPPDSGELWEKY